MPNHVPVIVVPEAEDELRRSIGVAHQWYTREISARMRWRGYLWQGGFASFPMGESYLIAAVRYVALNFIEAGVDSRPEDYPWSSAGFHCGTWCRIGANISNAPDERTLAKTKHASRTGRFLGGDTQIVCPRLPIREIQTTLS